MRGAVPGAMLELSVADPSRKDAMPTLESTKLHCVNDRLAGRILAPGEAGWDEARGAFNLLVDQRPAATRWRPTRPAGCSTSSTSPTTWSAPSRPTPFGVCAR